MGFPSQRGTSLSLSATRRYLIAHVVGRAGRRILPEPAEGGQWENGHALSKNGHSSRLEESGRLLDQFKEAASPPDWPAKLAEALRESRANHRMLLAWLDARHEARAHDG